MSVNSKGRNNEEGNRRFFTNHRILMLVTTLVCLLLAGFAWANKTVTLNVDGEERKVTTFALTTGQLLQAEEIQIGEYDRVTPDQNEFLRDGMTVSVKRAVPLKLKTGDTTKDIHTLSTTVQELLDEYGLTLQEEDQVIPASSELIKPGMTVEIIRQRTEIVEEEAAIPNETIRRNVSGLPSGKTRVVQEGRPGLEKQVWEITYRNGKVFNRELKSSEIIREPVDRIVEVGTSRVISRGGRTVRYSRALDMLSTAYTYTGNNTASGVPPRRGVAAVDPGVIPMSTRLYVENYGFCTALDRGSAIKGNRIDLFMESSQEANRWGVRRVKVYVLE